MAFGNVQLGTMLGKLKGTMEATTPNGTCSVLHSTPLLTSNTSPVTNCGSEVGKFCQFNTFFNFSHCFAIGLAIFFLHQFSQFF